jgi:DNA-binding MarR family transcriptional regulator
MTRGARAPIRQKPSRPAPAPAPAPALAPATVRTLTDFEQALTLVLRLLTERGRLEDVARRAGHELPPASWALLEHLDRLGALRVSDIAACHDVDVSSITPRLKALENAGLVARGALPTDARVSMIEITARGRRALERLHAAWREIVGEAVGDVAPEQLAVAARVLASMATQLRRPANGARR